MRGNYVTSVIRFQRICDLYLTAIYCGVYIVPITVWITFILQHVTTRMDKITTYFTN